MTGKRVSVKIQPHRGSESSFFAERDQKLLRQLSEIESFEATQKYCENINTIVFGVVRKAMLKLMKTMLKSTFV